jgi:hypothetical protein
MTEPDPYIWVNSHKLDELLSAQKDDLVVDDLPDALDRLLVDPLDSAVVTRLRGTDRHIDTYVAALPHEYVISYRVFPRGIPPHARPMPKVLDLVRLDDLFGSEG